MHKQRRSKREAEFSRVELDWRKQSAKKLDQSPAAIGREEQQKRHTGCGGQRGVETSFASSQSDKNRARHDDIRAQRGAHPQSIA